MHKNGGQKMCVGMGVDIRASMGMDVCIDRCTYMGIGEESTESLAEMCADMCRGMCIDMRTDM